jgi:hypothetical protein
MIEYALLIMLGFCVGGLIALLLAPTLWHRAVRLTTKRLEATLPMSLSDIEADKDLLRASYAIKIRRLEAGLSKAREKSANQLVEISKLQMKIGEFQDQIAELEMQLEERRNAANVFESTIRKRFPELESAVAAAKSALDERAFEINDLTNKMRRREEALGLAQRSANLQQREIRLLRETLEKSGSDATGRFKRRASQWTLDEYRSEYDRLNVELSKMREQLVLGHEREASQIAVLKTELQQLGEQIMSSVAAQDRQISNDRVPEPDAQPWPSVRSGQAAAVTPKRVGPGPGRPGARAQPWPGEKPQETKASAPAAPSTNEPARNAAPDPVALRQTPSRDLTEPAVRRRMSTSPHTPIGADYGAADLKEDDAPPVKQETREALQTLLDRGARISGKDNAVKASVAWEASPQTAPAAATVLNAAGGEGSSAGDILTSPDAVVDGAQPIPDPKLDQMFREIFESRSTPQSNAAAPATSASASPVPAEAPATERPAPQLDVDANSDADKKRTLLDRLRIMHERQTG